jgi:3-oxoacyl-[acyl-carrier protein] reductase
MSEQNGRAQRVAVVTGAARGIGAAIAKRLARENLAIAAVDLDLDQLGETVAAIEAAGGQCLPLAADVTEVSQVEHAVTHIAAELGPPVVLVNNAGITRDNLLAVSGGRVLAR